MVTPGIFARAGHPRCWDRNSDDGIRLVDQAVPLGRGLVAQNRTGTGSEQGGPEYCLPGGISGEGGVYASLQPLPSAASYPRPHRLGVDAHVLTLTPRDGGRLSLEALRERFG
jgi:hypothetical protein